MVPSGPFWFGTINRLTALMVVLCCITRVTGERRRVSTERAKCLELADNSTEHGTRLGLMEMAQAWLRLSEQAEKNSRSVYETPPRSDCTAMQ